jgi:hypothetical protein
MTEIARALPLLTGIQASTNLSAGFNLGASLGWAFPLAVPLGVPIASNPIMAAGLNGYMMIVDLAAATAGQLVVGIDITRPDLTGWGDPAVQLDTAVGTAAGGAILFQLGSLGRNQATNAQAWASLLFRFTLRHDTAAMVVDNLRLWALGRP